MTAAELKAAELNGMKEICSFTGFSESTVLGWIRDLGFPARKLGGVWISDGNEIVEWRRAYVRDELDAYMRRGFERALNTRSPSARSSANGKKKIRK